MDRQSFKQASKRSIIDFDNKKNRIRTFDLLRLYAMLSVVLDHSLQNMIGKDIQSTQLYNWIFLTQMPIFMFVSGYFALNGINKSITINAYFKKLLKTVASLFIPFISYAIIVSIILGENIVFKSILYPEYSLWFLWALMWMKILMQTAQQIAKKIAENKLSRMIISIVLYFVGLIPIGILYLKFPRMFETRLIIFYSLFFLLGYFYSFLDKNIRVLSNDKVKLLLIPVMLVIVVAVMIKHPTVMYDDESMINIAIRFIGSFGAIFLILYIANFATKKIQTIEKAAALGTLSLEMYYIHRLLLHLDFFNAVGTTTVVFIAKYILLIVVSIAVILIVKSFWVSDFVIFGELPQKKGDLNSLREVTLKKTEI